jgi:hypothetical protein
MYVYLDHFKLFSLSFLFVADEDSIPAIHTPIMDDSIMKAENH